MGTQFQNVFLVQCTSTKGRHQTYKYCSLFVKGILVRLDMIKRFFKPQTSSGSTSNSLSLSSPSCPVVNDNVNSSQPSHKDIILDQNLLKPNLGIERLNAHVSEVNSVHNRCFKMMLNLSNQAQSILTSFDKQSEKTKSEYRVRLNTSIDVARYLLKEGMSFRGHDEREASTRRGNFLDLLKWGSFKRREMLRDDQAEKLEELLVLGEIHTGSGLNQELGLQRADQDIVSAMKLVGFAKRQLQDMRDSRWNSLIKDVSLFCVKHSIVISEMNMNYVRGKSKRKKSSGTYSYNLRAEVFYAIIDLQLSELNNHFNKVNIDLLLSMASLSRDNSFVNYDKDKIMKLATHYPNEFTDSMLEDLSFELEIYIDYVREAGNEFSNLKRLGDLSETLVKTNLHMT
ncbi:uncharacterized protein LOC142177268 [Nicotiana tabacum]|uniref:Uncharacterized protein LOC142177268 n=1 Tax=Nicotiana tabacum TaxID=4097 RepID=A0AC58TXB1_TOBAC